MGSSGRIGAWSVHMWQKNLRWKQWWLRNKFLLSVSFQILGSREEESAKSERKIDLPLPFKSIMWSYHKYLNSAHYFFFGQAVLSIFCVGMCVYNEQLAHAHIRKDCLLFCSWSKHHFTTCYMFTFTSSPRGNLKAKGRRTKNVNILQKLTHQAVTAAWIATMTWQWWCPLSWTLLSRFLCPFGNICPRRPRPVVLPEAQSFNYSGQLVDPGKQGDK